jgi:hypothetical protein
MLADGKKKSSFVILSANIGRTNPGSICWYLHHYKSYLVGIAIGVAGPDLKKYQHSSKPPTLAATH